MDKGRAPRAEVWRAQGGEHRRKTMVDRRTILKAGAALATLAAAPRAARAADPVFQPAPGDWRGYEIHTIVEVASAEPVQIWAPAAALDAPGWSRPLGTNWTGNADSAALVSDPVYGAQIVHLEWRAGAGPRRVEIVSRVATRDRSVPLGSRGHDASLSAEERALYLRPTSLIPTDGIVKETSDKIVAGASTDVAKASAIYDWLVANTERIAATRGCGSGDIKAILAAEKLGGKCADINGLFVGLARGAGVPARDLYGIRVAASRFGYKSLGAGSTDVTKAQHCRADVWLEGIGWTPMDAADVRKVMLEEPPTHLSADEPKVVAAREALIGACEGNWVAFNCAHDVALPGASGGPVGFLMYPEGEVGGLRLDCLDPAAFRYRIEAREISI
jgi:transglutaminase-like putative cysteine protease